MISSFDLESATPDFLVPTLCVGTEAWDAPRPVAGQGPESGRAACATLLSLVSGRGASRTCVPTQSVGTRDGDWTRATVWALFLVLSPSSAHAAEVSSNGAGGGLWSEPAAWRGNAVPRPEDEVTIRKGDVITFDRNDEGKTTCFKLFIDPQGTLKFKTEAGKLVLVLSGPAESFGLLKLDGTKLASDQHELHLTGKTPADRLVKFQKGGALLASGKANLAEGKRNVRIVVKAPDQKAADVTGKVEVVTGATLDVQHCELVDLTLQGTEIDNTGARPNERVNIVANRCSGRCNVYLVACDSPVIADNQFDYAGAPWHQPAAVYLNGCPLADVKNNAVKGAFYCAFSIYGCTDSVVTGNTCEKCHLGVYCYGTAMFKANTIRDVTAGFIAALMTGMLEDCVFEKCGGYGVHVTGATIQMTNCVFRDPPTPGAHAVDFLSGEVLLVNCRLGPKDIVLPKELPKSEKPLVTSMHYLVLGVKGEAEEDTLVEVRTANPMPPVATGAMDLNVRNAPASLVNGHTPLPQSLSPILVRGWLIDKDGKTVPAPEYSVRVLGPTDGVKERKVYKQLTLKPQDSWYRSKPNDPTPTMEVSLR